MRFVVLGLLLMAISISPSQSQNSTVMFEFTCDGVGSTMSSYSYMKEPSLLDSGYSRGMKTGSFNYLEDGDIHLEETIKHGYGNGTINKSASAEHTLYVKFNGTRGISEFYGKGFFRNNRAISAWKKIRYEDLARYENVPLLNNRNGYAVASLGKSRSASEFNVYGTVYMETGTGWEKYNFDYNASVTDGVLETKDAAGWSNRTGMRRLDFEHHSLVSGDRFNVSNKLSDSVPWTTEAGPCQDWLSCCIGGTSPPYVPEIKSWSGFNNSYCSTCESCGTWPNDGIWGVLTPAKKLPNTNRTQSCIIDPWGEMRCSEEYQEMSCNDTNCSGFECIYEFGTVSTEKIVDELFGNYSSIDVLQVISDDPDETDKNKTVVEYTIRVANSGMMKLTDVTANVTLPVDMGYDRGYVVDDKDKNVSLESLDSFGFQKRDDNRTSVVFNIGDLQPDSKIRIRLFAKHAPGKVKQTDYYTSEVRVCAKDPRGNPVCQTAAKPT